MKHIPTIILALLFVVVMVLCGYYSYNLFINNTSSITIFTSQPLKTVDREVTNNTKEAIIILNGQELWDEQLKLNYKSQTSNINALIATNSAILKQNPNNNIVRYELGYYYLLQGNHVLAEKTFDEILKNNPLDKSTLLAKAYNYHYTKNHAQAIEVLDELISKEPNDIKLLKNKALVYESTNNKKDAELCYVSILRIDPSNLLAKNAMMKLRKK